MRQTPLEATAAAGEAALPVAAAAPAALLPVPAAGGSPGCGQHTRSARRRRAAGGRGGRRASPNDDRTGSAPDDARGGGREAGSQRVRGRAGLTRACGLTQHQSDPIEIVTAASSAPANLTVEALRPNDPNSRSSSLASCSAAITRPRVKIQRAGRLCLG